MIRSVSRRFPLDGFVVRSSTRWIRKGILYPTVSPSSLTPFRRHPIFVATPSTPILTSESSPPIAPSDLPIVTKTEEMPHLPLSVTLDKSAVSKTTKSKKQVKVRDTILDYRTYLPYHSQFSIKRKSPVKANVKSMPSDSSNCDNTRFNSFQVYGRDHISIDTVFLSVLAIVHPRE